MGVSMEREENSSEIEEQEEDELNSLKNYAKIQFVKNEEDDKKGEEEEVEIKKNNLEILNIEFEVKMNLNINDERLMNCEDNDNSSEFEINEIHYWNFDQMTKIQSITPII